MSFLHKNVEGTLEMGKNRKALENENRYCERKSQESTGYYCDSFSLHFHGYCLVNQQKVSHFHTVHFKNGFSVRETMGL